MAKNRKNQSAAVRFGPALKALLLCLFIGGSGVGYVWQKNQIHQLGVQIGAGEKRFEQVKRQREELERQLAYLRSHAMLEIRIRELNLGLAMPRPEQILVLPERTNYAPGNTTSVSQLPSGYVAGTQ